METDDIHLWDELTESVVRLSFNLITGNAYGRFIDFAAFLIALRTPERFREAFGLLDKVLVFDDVDQWRFSEFPSFGDVAINCMVWAAGAEAPDECRAACQQPALPEPRRHCP